MAVAVLRTTVVFVVASFRNKYILSHAVRSEGLSVAEFPGILMTA